MWNQNMQPVSPRCCLKNEFPLLMSFFLVLSVKHNKAVWTEEELQVVKHRPH